MLKKLTSILLSLMLVLSAVSVFAAEAPTLVSASETLTNADVITLATYTDTTDAENPVVKYKAYRNRSIITATTTSANYTYDVLRDDKVYDNNGKGWSSELNKNPYDSVKAYYRMSIEDVKSADKIELQLYCGSQAESPNVEVYVSPVDEAQAEALYAVAADKNATVVQETVVPEKKSAICTTGTMVGSNMTTATPFLLDVTEYVNAAIEAEQDYVTFEVNAKSSSSSTNSVKVVTKGAKQAQLVLTNNVVSFKNQRIENYKIAATEFAMADIATPDSTVTLAAANNVFNGRQLFVKADLSDYSMENLESVLLKWSGWGGSHTMNVYNLDATSWDAAALTYNGMKSVIESAKAGDPDYTVTIKGQSYVFDIENLINEDQSLNVMIEYDGTATDQKMYGPASPYGPRIDLIYSTYENTDAITDNIPMKIKASAASFETGTAAVPFVALYDSNGALSEVIKGDVITTGGTDTTEITITAAQTKAANTIKVFMWTNGTLVPLTETVSQINK